ncbi:lysyl oxidase family protein, partial [Escherichia coli]|uniref:lysyl oxidase family protein n=1 Tax=Escherichia coli TaxID=562 RepID=UPI0039E19B2F
MGDAAGDPSLFIVDPCHGHWHYKEFIQHIILNSRDEKLMMSHKDGFCISDLECPKGIVG